MRVPRPHIDWRRVKSAVPIFVIAACVAGVFYLQALTISQLSDQVHRQNEVLEQLKGLAEASKKNAADRTRQIDGLDKHMDCIVKFFSLKDRSLKAIEEINTCRISTTSAAPQQSAPTTTQPPSAKKAPVKKQPAVEPETQRPPAVAPQPEPSFIERLLNPLLGLFQPVTGRR
jgi:hypothetical protein